MDEQPGALEVGEELVPEPYAFACSFDQTGDVGHDELPAVRRFHRPEDGRERRERILRDLRPSVRDPGQERRLACIRETDERGVGEELQAKLDLLLLTGQADLREPRRLTDRPGEVLVAAAPQAALRNHDPRARVREIGNELVAVEDLRPDRHAEDRVLSAGAIRETSAPASPPTAAELLVRTKAGEVAPARVGDDHDVASVTAVSPVRPAARHVLLAPEVD